LQDCRAKSFERFYLDSIEPSPTAVNLLLGRLEKPDKKIDSSSGYSNNLRQKLNKSALVSGIGTGVADSGDEFHLPIYSMRSDDGYNNYLSK
jgi:hypothetical protein